MKNKKIFFSYILILLILLYSLFTNRHLLLEKNKDNIIKKKDYLRFIIPDKKTNSDITLFNIDRNKTLKIRNSNFIDIPLYSKDQFLVSYKDKELYIPYYSTSEVIYYPIKKDEEKEIILDHKRFFSDVSRIFMAFYFEALKNKTIETHQDDDRYIFLRLVRPSILITMDKADVMDQKDVFFIRITDQDSNIFGKEFNLTGIEYDLNIISRDNIDLKIPVLKDMKKEKKWGKTTYQFREFGLNFNLIEGTSNIIYNNPDNPMDKGILTFHDNKLTGIGFDFDQENNRYIYTIFE